MLFEPASSGEDSIDHEHKHSSDNLYKSFSLILDKPVDWSVLGVWLTMLLHRHGENILRVKGTINPGNGQPLLTVQGVQHIVYPPQHIPRPSDYNGASQIVFIAKDIEKSAVEESLLSFLALGESLKSKSVAA